MKVLFSNPPWWGTQDGQLMQGVRAGSRWPFMQPAGTRYLPYPFFMGYAASYVDRIDGVSATLRDSIALGESYKSFLDHADDLRPDYVVIESATPSWAHDQVVIRKIHERMPYAKIIVTGPIAVTTIDPSLPIHAVVRGEYEKGVAKVIAGACGDVGFDLLTEAEMNAAPWPMLCDETLYRYFDHNPIGQVQPHAQVWSSRGCPFKCLAGDTPINTTHGKIPIRDLVGRRDVGVFTYDSKTRAASVVTPRVIAKTGEGRKLLRVRFDDGSHIDCTPDHRFVVFKWGNQFAPEREWLVEAKDLAKGARVRAIRQVPSGQYLDTTWARRGREKTHRMVAEWKIGRRLLPGEVVHHIDGDKLNWHPDNLQVFDSMKEHIGAHPEIAERMRINNPTAKGITQQWRDRISASNRGKVRSAESRERYRLAAIKREQSKTFEERSAQAKRSVATRVARGDKVGNTKRKADGTFNHRVVSVEELPGVHDTYCMEIPGTHVFYANDVLVRNCLFCVWPATMTGNDPDGTRTRTVRHYSPDHMLPYLLHLKSLGFRSIYFDDDTFNLGTAHVRRMCGVMREVGLPWSAMCRADTSRMECWQEMRDAGCFGVKLGFESGSQYVVDAIVNKHLDLEYARRAVHEIKRLGMTVHGTFTVGLPGETPEQMRETMAYIESLPMDSHQISGTAEIEGTPLHTLRERGSLEAYAGATMDADAVMHTDGVKRWGELAKQLRET